LFKINLLIDLIGSFFIMKLLCAIISVFILLTVSEVSNTTKTTSEIHIVVEQTEDFQFSGGYISYFEGSAGYFSGRRSLPCPQYVPSFSFTAVSAFIGSESTVEDQTEVRQLKWSSCGGGGSTSRSTYSFERKNDDIKVVKGHKIILGKSINRKGCIKEVDSHYTIRLCRDCTPKFQEFPASFDLKGRKFIGCE
jgi:hypothetical protein